MSSLILWQIRRNSLSKQSIVHASHSVFRKAKSKQGYMLLKCLRRYIVLDILAGLEVHMESTLRLYANELVKYSQAIKVCLLFVQ